MTDTDFRQLCNTFGFAPSRALRELIDCVRAQELEACAQLCIEITQSQPLSNRVGWEHGTVDCAAAIRARKDKQ